MKRYGVWSGNPRGIAEDTIKCIDSVYPAIDRGMIEAQCSRKRGYGERGLFCKQHAKRSREYQLERINRRTNG